MRLLPHFGQKSPTGFTLIELLIAISIIAILSTVGLMVYGNSQRLARDSKRKSDIKQIQNALALYYQDHKQYPAYIASGSSGSCSSQNSGGYTLCVSSGTNPWINGLNTNYINALPKDPIADAGGDPAEVATATGYGYRVYTSITNPASTCPTGASQVYLLYVKLENTSDADRLGAKNYNWCGNGQPLISGHNFSPNVYIVGSYL